MARSRRKHDLRHVAERLEQAARTVADAARASSGEGPTTINLTKRINAVVSANVGEPGSTHVATQHQYAPIRQGHSAAKPSDGASSKQSSGGEPNHGA